MERTRGLDEGQAQTGAVGGSTGVGDPPALQTDGGIGPVPLGFGYQVTYYPHEDFGYLTIIDEHFDYSVGMGGLTLNFSRDKGLVGLEFWGLTAEARIFFGLS